MLNRGLIVVTGPTGSGKSTTLAVMVDYANKNRKDHIITLEDPIEFVHTSNFPVVRMRSGQNILQTTFRSLKRTPVKTATKMSAWRVKM